MKCYVPVGDFERHTSYCPTYFAWHILDEARDYFRTSIPEDYAAELARRAETVFAKHPFWRRKYKSCYGRENVLMSMRHWLASILARERPALFRALPDSFKIGHPLPPHSPLRLKTTHSRPNPPGPVSHFVHGCELLAI